MNVEYKKKSTTMLKSVIQHNHYEINISIIKIENGWTIHSIATLAKTIKNLFVKSILHLRIGTTKDGTQGKP